MTHDNSNTDDDAIEEGRGRSKRKREQNALDKLALTLSRMKLEQTASFPITDELKQAIQTTINTKAMIAKRRYVRHLGGMLRDRPDETEAIISHLKGDTVIQIVGDEDYRDLNVLRQKLCEEKAFEETLDQASAVYTHLDRSLIRSLTSHYRLQQDEQSYKKIFKELRRAADEAERELE